MCGLSKRSSPARPHTPISLWPSSIHYLEPATYVDRKMNSRKCAAGGAISLDQHLRHSPNNQVSTLGAPRSVRLSAGGTVDLLAAAIHYRVDRILAARPATGIVGPRGGYGVLVAGVRIPPTRIYAGTYILQGKGRLHPVGVIHGLTDSPTDGSAREGAHDDGCSAAATASDLIAQQAAECAADYHAGLFVKSICGAATQDQGGP